jgi:hypothetical protein
MEPLRGGASSHLKPPQELPGRPPSDLGLGTWGAWGLEERVGHVGHVGLAGLVGLMGLVGRMGHVRRVGKKQHHNFTQCCFRKRLDSR